MAVHIRLARHGSRKAPFYRVVVADQRNSRDGRFIEHIGLFDPRVSNTPFTLDQARYDYWTKQGATPSATLSRLVKQAAAKSV
jgi:small subunit ribosomal protein S16